MKLNLDNLRAEIQTYLEQRGIAVFLGRAGAYHEVAAVYWDTDRSPDFRAFLAVAEAAGTRLVALDSDQFDEDVIDEALELISESHLTGSERSSIERRLREMRRYNGRTCQVELSFDHLRRIYVFELRSEWFEELTELLNQIDEATDHHDLPEPPGAGYFSKN